MPYPRREPVEEEEVFLKQPELGYIVDTPSEREMFKGAHPGYHTICETLREAYQMSQSDEQKTKLRLAWAMAKAMRNRLHEYAAKYEPWRKHVV